MKKKEIFAWAIALALIVCGCSKTPAPLDENNADTPLLPTDTQVGDDGESEEPTGVITDMRVIEESSQENIIEIEQEDGEAVVSSYYLVSKDSSGRPVYSVKRATTGQLVQLPMGDTVLYSSDAGANYYKTVTYQYELDGETRTMVQYQLYVSEE